MITEKFLTIIFSVFDWIFSKLPIPPIPDFYTETIKPFIREMLTFGSYLITWFVPSAIWSVFWNTIYTLILVNLLYSIYSKLHKLIKRSA